MANKKSDTTRMEAQLRGFLENFRVKKGEPFTHTSKIPSGCYYIGDDSYQDFITTYCNAIGKSVVPTITEKPGAYAPLRIDIDLKANLDVGLKRQYTTEILKKIVGYFQNEIREIIPEDKFEEKHLWCIVLEKQSPRVEEGIIKDGFHLHFPYFICEGWIQDEYLRNKVNQKMIEDNTWEGCRYIQKPEKFIDEGMAKKVWLMYGSAKDPNVKPFLATRAWTGDLSDISLDDIFAEQMKGKKSKVRYYLPRFLTIRGHKLATPIKEEVEAKRSIYVKKKAKRSIIIKKRSMHDVLLDIKVIKDGDIMSMLSDERADDFNSWMDVGWTLFNIGQGCDEALELWIEFSKRSPKFVDGDCEERWSRMEMKGKTIGSLLAMAKSDNPDMYKEWKDSHVRTFLYKALVEAKPNEWDVAQVVYCNYKGRFLCADSKKDIWYEFVNHKWQYMDDGVTLRKLLATEVAELFNDLQADLAVQMKGKDEDSRQKLEKQRAKCVKIITALKECTFQDKVIRMCKVNFHDIHFLKKIDENKMLFVCDNGVIDLEMGIFRDGRPDDYMTYSCNIHFHHYNKDDDEMIELKEFLKKVFPNKKLRSYFKDVACAAMEGGNVNKTLIIGTGGGDNAKSVTFALLEMTFGEYCIKFPRELLTVGRGNSSSSARPELSRVRGRRLALVQEIAKTETLNIGVLKELTGNDSFFARGVYEKGTEIKPMFTLMMQNNEPPNVPGHDDATWNRIRLLDFESKFIKPQDLNDNPVPLSPEEQFKQKKFHADLGFGKKLPELAPVMLCYLFLRYKKYKPRGLIEPPEVKMSTSVYRERNDIYLQFIRDKIEEIQYPKGTEEKDEVFLKLSDLYAEFISWYQEIYSSYKEKFNRNSVFHEFNKKLKRLGKQGRIQGWYGYKIAEDEPEDEKQRKLQHVLDKAKHAESTAPVKTDVTKTEPTKKTSTTQIKPTEKVVSTGKKVLPQGAQRVPRKVPNAGQVPIKKPVVAKAKKQTIKV